MSDRDNLDSDCKTVNAIVNALSARGDDNGSLESLQHQPHQRRQYQQKPLPTAASAATGGSETPGTPRMHNNLRNLGRMIAEANLPRAVSQGQLMLLPVGDGNSGGGPVTSPMDKSSYLSKSAMLLEQQQQNSSFSSPPSPTSPTSSSPGQLSAYPDFTASHSKHFSHQS